MWWYSQIVCVALLNVVMLLMLIGNLRYGRNVTKFCFLLKCFVNLFCFVLFWIFIYNIFQVLVKLLRGWRVVKYLIFFNVKEVVIMDIILKQLIIINKPMFLSFPSRSELQHLNSSIAIMYSVSTLSGLHHSSATSAF